MARVVVTVPGERVVEEFTALVQQATTPSPMAPPPHIGIVEISQSQPTELIPGPMGPAGTRGSRWFTGDGAPVLTTGLLLGDMYLDNISGDVWVWDGDSWEPTGTNIQGSPDTPAQVLDKIKTVDGAGSGLDADLLDGQHGAYYATQDSQTAQDTRMTSIEAKNTSQDTAINLKADIASPTFTGDPKAPTPATSDNDTSIATTAYVKTNLAAYAPLASPALTGNPTAPTPTAGDSDTSLATTEFVSTAIGNRPTDAPSDSQTYGRKNGAWVDAAEEAPADGITYGRKNGAWVASIGGATVSDAPPTPPLVQGQLWFEADTGNTYVWYVDANSSQWVQVNVLPGSQPVPSQTALPRNRVVNGAFQIAQEQASTSVSGQYFADQWVLGIVGGGTATAYQIISGTGSTYRSTARLLVGTADTSIAAGDALQIYQPIEGIRIKDFFCGLASAKPMVLRFNALIYGNPSAMGTYYVSLRDGGGTVSFVAPFTPAVFNEWQTFTIPIPACTIGTWPSDNSRGAYLTFAFADGATTRAPTDNVWLTGNYRSGNSMSNGWATSGNDFRIADVGLYLDPDGTGVAPKWEMPDEAEELRACWRYYYKTASDHRMGMDSSTTATPRRFYDQVRPVNMRATPTSTCTITNATTATPVFSETFDRILLTVSDLAPTANAINMTNYTASARM